MHRGCFHGALYNAKYFLVSIENQAGKRWNHEPKPALYLERQREDRSAA
jgi:hypothetical protein